MDGKSFKWALLGQANPNTERALFFHNVRPRLWSTGDTTSSAIIQGNYKLIDFFDNGTYELYDISADTTESNNLPE